MAISHDDISIKTLIGAGTFIKGALSVKGLVRFDGDIDGDLETSGNIIIGEQARIRGNVTANSAIVNGIILGDIVAPEGVKLFASSIVLGDVVSKKIYLEEKVLLQGKCVVLKDEEKFDEAKKQWQDEKAIREKTLFVNSGGK